MVEKRVVIVGGGFGGIACALALAEKELDNIKIVLISDKPHFEYHATLYRVLSGHSPMESCIPLREIFRSKRVEVVEDRIMEVHPEKKTLSGSWDATYKYDYLVLALGSEPSYYGIQGLQEYSFSLNSVKETLRLKRHLHEVFSTCAIDKADEKSCDAHVVVVGGGASGVETAGELAFYAREVAEKHGVDPSFVTIDLIHSGSRLMPMLPEKTSHIIEQRLHAIGVNLFLNRRLMKEEVKDIYFKDMQMQTKTLLWTAGVKPNRLYRSIPGMTLDDQGKVTVDTLLLSDVPYTFVVGDAAATPYSGMAKTALYDGQFVAEVITSVTRAIKFPKYNPPRPVFSIPVGRFWAASLFFDTVLYGIPGWFLRKWMDLRFFLSILPFFQAITAFRSDQKMWESCPICSKKETSSTA